MVSGTFHPEQSLVFLRILFHQPSLAATRADQILTRRYRRAALHGASVALRLLVV
jgi:hypothetical protein